MKSIESSPRYIRSAGAMFAHDRPIQVRRADNAAGSSWLRMLLMTIAVLPFAIQTGGAQQDTRPRWSVGDVRVGFMARYKPGHWLPIAIDVESKNDVFSGVVEIVTPDSDGLETSLYTQLVHVGKDERRTIHHFVRPGGSGAVILVRMRFDRPGGRIAAERQINLSDGNLRSLIEPQERMILGLGSPAGIADACPQASAGGSHHEYVHLADGLALPTHWFAYDAVETVIFATSSPQIFDQIDRDTRRTTALQTWVRQGGHLVVSVGQNWQVVSKSFLAPMLPAKLEAAGRLQRPDKLEGFILNPPPFKKVGDQGIPIVRLGVIRGKILGFQTDPPVIVSGTYGLGKVTLLAFDTDVGPFSNWASGSRLGHRDFWIKLLGFPALIENVDPNQPMMGQWNNTGYNDLASRLHTYLENFPDVTVVSFHWVAILIFGYILLIGPIDYLFLKKVVGRLELTWITFPFWVIAISVAAYFAAHWLKGDDLRINRVEFVDVDAASSTLRGSSFMSIFSPRIDNYSTTMTPGLAAAGTWNELGMGQEQPDRFATWLGLPEMSFRGAYSRGSTGILGRRGYGYGDTDAGSLASVPIQVWSVKTFAHRWLGKAGPTLSAELKAGDALLSGKITSQLTVALDDVIVVHRDRVYKLGRLEPNHSATIIAATTTPTPSDSFAGFFGGLRMQGNQYDRGPAVPIDALARWLCFGNKAPDQFRAEATNHYLFDLDLSDLLALDKIIVMGRVAGDGGQLWLNAQPVAGQAPPKISGKMNSQTFLRVILEPNR